MGVPPMQSMIESQILSFVIGPSPYVALSVNRRLLIVVVISPMMDMIPVVNARQTRASVSPKIRCKNVFYGDISVQLHGNITPVCSEGLDPSSWHPISDLLIGSPSPIPSHPRDLQYRISGARAPNFGQHSIRKKSQKFLVEEYQDPVQESRIQNPLDAGPLAEYYRDELVIPRLMKLFHLRTADSPLKTFNTQYAGSCLPSL